MSSALWVAAEVAEAACLLSLGAAVAVLLALASCCEIALGRDIERLRDLLRLRIRDLDRSSVGNGGVCVAGFNVKLNAGKGVGEASGLDLGSCFPVSTVEVRFRNFAFCPVSFGPGSRRRFWNRSEHDG
uniref:Putative secreted protein n=1 Tax=Ixodes ricinus TaxID=34613 RepID=A0A6B0UQH2_IXORI